MSSPGSNAAACPNAIEWETVPLHPPPLVRQDAVCLRDWSSDEIKDAEREMTFNKVLDDIAALKSECIAECDNEYDPVDMIIWDTSPAYWILNNDYTSDASRELCNLFTIRYHFTF